MKLIVEKGELNLPEDFSFEIEQNSAFFSEDGTASVGATIPATPDDLAKLDHPTRIARNTKFVNLFPAILSHGTFQKKGNLMVTSASKDGITCSMALEDSEFYSKWKESNLKELFDRSILYMDDTVGDLYATLNTIYKQPGLSSTICLFPVAVNYDQENDSYQINNEPLNEYGSVSGTYSLKWQARTVMEGDVKVSVPDGYGIAPFFYLKAFIRKMFQRCGYSMGTNCFATNPKLSSLVLVHNCSDVICKACLDLADIVPNKTISEFLEWLQNKFHAQIVVHPAEKKVDVVLMNDILEAGYDMDLTGKLIDNIVFSYEQSKRIVLTPDTSLDGAAPVAETEEELLKKYGYVHEFASGNSQFPLYFENEAVGLLLHLATGTYYEISRNSRNQTRSKRVGTNYFTYDRKNTQEAESISWEDIMPPMVLVDGMLMPYIGKRTHRNTSYTETEKDEEQEIMVVDFAGLSTPITLQSSGSGQTRVFDFYTHSGHYYYGTTQKYDNTGALRQGKYSLIAPEMYELFFAKYAKMLRNNLVKVEGQFDIPIERLLSYGMYSLKLYEGQKLLPVSLKYEVGRKIRCLNAAFYQVKDYVDGEEDTPTVIPEPIYQWVENTSEADAAVAALQPSYPNNTLSYHIVTSEEDEDFFLPAPSSLGLKSATFARTIEIGYYYRTRPGESATWRAVQRTTVNFWYESAAI